MRFSRIVSRVSFGLLFGLLFAVAGHAQTALFREYAAKFTCGTEPASELDDVVTGVYASSINIHNPQAKTTVVFIKKIVIAPREGNPFVTPKVLRGVLTPDQADRVDCRFIWNQLNLPLFAYLEGFIVVEALPTTAGVPELDVVGKYTARPQDGRVSTQSVVIVSGKLITH